MASSDDDDDDDDNDNDNDDSDLGDVVAEAPAAHASDAWRAAAAAPANVHRVVRVRDENVRFVRASCKRASRAAKASTPSASTQQHCREIIRNMEQQFELEGRRKLANDTERRVKLAPLGSGSGAARGAARAALHAHEALGVVNDVESGVRTQRLQHQNKDVDTHNQVASWLLGGETCAQMYDSLAESALRSNAVNACVTQRRDTQGAAFQTTRINCKAIGHAAAPQCVVVAVAAALAEARLRARGIRVVNPHATNAVDPCVFAMPDWAEQVFTDTPRATGEEMVCVVSTGGLVYNANPTRVGADGIVAAAERLARFELSEEGLSRVVTAPQHMIRCLCRALTERGFVAEPMWAAIVIIVYVCCDPRSRKLLAQHTDLTDVDVQTVFALEAYGRGEITRRARLRAARRAAQPPPARRASTAHDDPTGLPVEEDDASIVNDDSDNDVAVGEDSFVDLLDAAWLDEDNPSDERLLAAKRKRPIKGVATAVATDAYSVLNWWYRALRCDHRYVLETLVAEDEKRAAEAAAASLRAQQVNFDDGSGVAGCEERELDQTLKYKACLNAQRSQRAVQQFVQIAPADTMRWVLYSVRTESCATGAAVRELGVGLWRGPTELDTPSTLHACTLAPADLQPPRSARMAMLWSEATCALRPEEGNHQRPNVLEAFQELAVLRKEFEKCKTRGRYSVGAKEERVQRCALSHVQRNSHPASASVLARRTRSFFALRTIFAVRRGTIRTAEALAGEALATASAIGTSSGVNSTMRAFMCEICKTPERRAEPLCTPAAPLAIGLRVGELVRRLMRGRTRKNDPCKVLLGVHTPAESSRDMLPVMDCEPFPMAVITDFDVRVDDAADPLPDTPTLEEERVPATTTLHVCVDAAVRVPDMMSAVAAAGGDRALWQQRGLLYAASSQASLVGETGTSMSASWVNTAINSSKRISTADVGTLCLLSAWDVLGGGLTSVGPSLLNSAYTGAYGPSLDHGLTSVGLAAHYLCSDKRGHGSMTLSQDAADRIATALASVYHVRTADGQSYATTPIATRGIPHGYVPRVHRVLDDMADALDRVFTDDATGRRKNEDTVLGLFSLPFSAFTQALRPDVECTADATMRHCFRDPRELSCATGRSYLPDSTSENEALVREPLWRRPCQSSSGDNPFATSYEHVDALFNALNALALIARCCGGVEALHSLVCQWHASEQDADAYQWAADACVLIFGVVFPHAHAIDECVVPECYARACALHAQRARAGGGGARLGALVGAAQLVHARALWSRFDRSADTARCAWKQGVAPMLALILEHEGSHELCVGQRAEFRKRLDGLATRGAWLAYSEDGVHPPPFPNPAASCASPDAVRSTTLDPVFAAHGSMLEHPARGCLVGLKPFQLRQIYALLLGAHLPGVERVQAVRNEGGLLLRESALPTVLQTDGRPRSSKGIAPIQTESDRAAFGTRKSKCYGAEKQRRAWDENALLQSPLFCALHPPQSKRERLRGQHDGDNFLHFKRVAQADGCDSFSNDIGAYTDSLAQESKRAQTLFCLAANSDLARAARERMRRSGGEGEKAVGSE